MQYQNAVEAIGLTKRYRSKAVVNNLTLRISQGEVAGILGPNGAGKSTLMRLLIGAARPTEGSIRLLKKGLGDPALRGRIGYLAEDCPLQEFLSPYEQLSLHASLTSGGKRDDVIVNALERAGLALTGRVGELSRGMRQRLGIAMAMLNSPELVILDEPTSALDQEGRAHVRELVSSAAESGRTALISSHLLTEIEHSCSRIIILNHGSIIADGRVEDLISFTSKVVIEVKAINDRAILAMRQIAASVELDPASPNRFIASVTVRSDASAIASALLANGVELVSIEPRMETLDELFTRLTLP